MHQVQLWMSHFTSQTVRRCEFGPSHMAPGICEGTKPLMNHLATGKFLKHPPGQITIMILKPELREFWEIPFLFHHHLGSTSAVESLCPDPCFVWMYQRQPLQFCHMHSEVPIVYCHLLLGVFKYEADHWMTCGWCGSTSSKYTKCCFNRYTYIHYITLHYTILYYIMMSYIIWCYHLSLHYVD